MTQHIISDSAYISAPYYVGRYVFYWHKSPGYVFQEIASLLIGNLCEPLHINVVWCFPDNMQQWFLQQTCYPHCCLPSIRFGVVSHLEKLKSTYERKSASVWGSLASSRFKSACRYCFMTVTCDTCGLQFSESIRIKEEDPWRDDCCSAPTIRRFRWEQRCELWKWWRDVMELKWHFLINPNGKSSWSTH